MPTIDSAAKPNKQSLFKVNKQSLFRANKQSLFKVNKQSLFFQNKYKILAYLLFTLAFFIIIATFGSAIYQEFRYSFSEKNKDVEILLDSQQPKINDDRSPFGDKILIPADKDFSIIVPKIGANSKVVANVDSQNSAEYQVALTKGVAHAEGTSLPDQDGNVFLFAHSSNNFYNANIYNSVFYLLHRLEKEDIFYIVYKENIYRYKVTETKIVNANDIQYFTGKITKKTATLMTCWPAGTTFKRLVVVGEITSTD